MKCQTFFCASLIILFAGAATSQNRQYVRIRERPLVRFEWECTKPSLYERASFDKVVRRQLPKDWPASSVWGDRAYAYDLNGDGVKESFVPLYCGATGNCKWAILAINPIRKLGIVWGENFYVHKRIGQWSRITITSHINISESLIDTYHFVGNQYRKFGRVFVGSAYSNSFPKLLLTVEPLCNPDYIPGSIRAN